MTTNRNHGDETTAAIRKAVEVLKQARIDAYATGEEVGADVDYAISGLGEVLQRIASGNVGTPYAL